jgi:REP element-mobilizing transposase RayT
MDRQMSFFKPTSKEFGGTLALKGKRKTARVLDCSKPIHFVLKSKKTVTLYHHRVLLRKLLYLYAKRFGVKVYKESVQKDHFHFCIKITNRPLYRSFIRALTGVISQHLGKGLWSLIPYSRVVYLGTGFFKRLRLSPSQRLRGEQDSALCHAKIIERKAHANLFNIGCSNSLTVTVQTLQLRVSKCLNNGRSSHLTKALHGRTNSAHFDLL